MKIPEIKQQEEILEYISKSIVGDKNITLEIKDVPMSMANPETKEIFIQENIIEAEDEDELYKFRKTHNLHESGHLLLSGSLRKEFEDWFDEDGDFNDFKFTVNAIEDVRIEYVMTQLLPQSTKYFVQNMDKFIDATCNENGEIEVKDFNLALRFALENKSIVRYKIDDVAKPYIDKAVEI